MKLLYLQLATTVVEIYAFPTRVRLPLLRKVRQ